FFIPSGCVHAIGSGVMLYEIQQASDLTYRVYDYNRMGADGKKRDLHVQKALDVLAAAKPPERVRLPDAAGVFRVFNERCFTVDSLVSNDRLSLPPCPSFGILTALDPLSLYTGYDRIPALPMRTFLLPASCPSLTLEGRGRALLAMPKEEEVK
ncbi:MAG: mannose-6-phosphate isomerase, partial [Clostridia bacterium]|nr:mannose-6-phosphate isomerase [Clostridia bacterium]